LVPTIVCTARDLVGNSKKRKSHSSEA
jgi:hypothetical protein